MRRIITISIIVSVFAGLLFAQEVTFTRALLEESSAEVASLQTARAAQSQNSRSGKSAKPQRRRIDFMADYVSPYNQGGDSVVYFTGNFAAHHNGAVIACDSAVRFNDTKWGFYGDVIINQDSIYIYGDSAKYDGDANIAEVFAPIVKVVDGDALLYTYNFSFNTAEKIGTYTGGGVLVHDNDILESQRGYYYSDTHDVICVEDVEIHGSNYDTKSDSVIYNTDTKFARFFTNSEIWDVDGTYLSANEGFYDNALNMYKVTLNGYILSEKQEVWGDTLTYFRSHEHVIAEGNIQMDDTEQKILAFGDYAEYWGLEKSALLTRNPVAIGYDTTESDSIFISADTMRFNTISRLAEERAALRKAIADSIAQADSIAKARAELIRIREERLAEKAKQDSLALIAQRTAEFEAREQALQDSLDAVELAAKEAQKAAEQEQQRAAEQAQQAEVAQNVTTEQAEQAATTTDDNASADNKKSSEKRAEKGAKKGAEKDKNATKQDDADNKPLAEQADTVNNAATLAQDSLAVDSLATDSLRLDSMAIDTANMTIKQLRKYAKEQAKLEKANIKKAKAKARKLMLDSIGLLRRAKAVELYKRQQQIDLKRYTRDSLRRANKRAKLLAKGRDVSALDSLDSLASMERQRLMTDSLQKDSMAKNLLAQDSMATDSLSGAMTADSLAADSLATDSTQVDSLYRVVKAYRKVRIFRKDVQAICDSLVSSTTDSIIHMYFEPVLWNGTNQIASAQLDAYTQNQQILRAEFLENPIMVSEVDTSYYNQVTGKTMTAHFANNEIYRNDVDGNVQTIYFQREDERSAVVTEFVYLEGASATFYIENRDVVAITYRNDVPLELYPIALIPENQMRKLPNFKWVPELRPTRENIFNRTIRPSRRAESASHQRPTFRIVEKMDRFKERLLEQGLWMDREDELKPDIVEWRDTRD